MSRILKISGTKSRFFQPKELVTPSTVPGIIAWTLISFMTLVLVGRYRWFNRNLYDRYFNNTLAFLLVAQMLREHLVQNTLVRTAFMTTPGTWQLGTAVMGTATPNSSDSPCCGRGCPKSKPAVSTGIIAWGA